MQLVKGSATQLHGDNDSDAPQHTVPSKVNSFFCSSKASYTVGHSRASHGGRSVVPC